MQGMRRQTDRQTDRQTRASVIHQHLLIAAFSSCYYARPFFSIISSFGEAHTLHSDVFVSLLSASWPHRASHSQSKDSHTPPPHPLNTWSPTNKNLLSHIGPYLSQLVSYDRSCSARTPPLLLASLFPSIFYFSSCCVLLGHTPPPFSNNRYAVRRGAG